MNVFSDLTLFVCTYVAKLENINISFEILTKILSKKLTKNVVAINSNYGHFALDEYKKFIKSPKKKVLQTRTRKIQGDGTCFNSAIEPVIKLNDDTDKFYLIKCFPTTGETQIPGVIRSDLSDADEVLEIFVNYLNSFDELNSGKKISVINKQAKMLNYKFKLNKNSDNELINLINLNNYFFHLENNKITIENNIYVNFDDDSWIIIYPPFLIKEVKPSVDDIKVSFKIQTSKEKSPRINIFQSGKVNVLGANNEDSIKLFYNFISELFRANWDKLINIKPEKDII